MADFGAFDAPVPIPKYSAGQFPEYPGTFAVNTALGAATPPTVTNFVPVLGPIDRLQPLQFDVLDDSGLIAAFILLVGFAGTLPSELVYMKVPGKSGFCARYQGVETAVTGGLRFSGVKRLGGWPGAPHFYAYPLDAAGNLG